MVFEKSFHIVLEGWQESLFIYVFLTIVSVFIIKIAKKIKKLLF